MIVSSPDKALLKLLWDHVRGNGSFDAVPFSHWAEKVRELEEAGIPVYETNGDADALHAALKRDAVLLESMGFVRTVPEAEAASLTLLGQLHAENLSYPDWARELLARTRHEQAR